MIAQVSRPENIDRNDISTQAEVIRELVKTLTQPNYSVDAMNGVVINKSETFIVDNAAPGWTFTGSTKDGSNLGSGSGFVTGDGWTISKGSKEVTFVISDTSSGEWGLFGIEVYSSENPTPVPLQPGRSVGLLTSSTSNNVVMYMASPSRIVTI